LERWRKMERSRSRTVDEPSSVASSSWEPRLPFDAKKLLIRYLLRTERAIVGLEALARRAGSKEEEREREKAAQFLNP